MSDSTLYRKMTEGLFPRPVKLAGTRLVACAGELGDEVLDASEKRTLLASLDKEIDRLQRELAELVWQARDAGHDVDFPTDLPAAAILGVAA